MNYLESFLENDTHKHVWDFDVRTDHFILARRPDLFNNQQKKKTCQFVYFVVPADHRIKLKENEKRNKDMDLAWELK